MKKFFSPAALLFLAPLVLLLQGCLKDSCINTYKIYSPVYKSLTQVREEMKSTAPQPIKTPGKIFLYGNYIFMNELDKGIHVIDNSNPSSPSRIGYINIPGNVDLAVKGSYLYADSYSDIVVFNISNPVNVTPVKFMNNVLKETDRFWGNKTNPDDVMIIVDYIERDTTVDCETYSRWSNCRGCFLEDKSGGFFTTNTGSLASAGASAPSGKGGSMARFTLAGNYLYGVSWTNLYAINLANPADPVLTNTKNLGWGIETIYPFGDKLFIGSTSGMFIYNINEPSNPVAMGQFNHVRSCDPVIADGQYAYVTLRSGTTCQGFSNQLEVVDIANLNNPFLVKTYSMTNPHGLDKDGNTLFICDGRDGLRILNAADVNNIQPIKQITGLETYDVITMNGKAIVVAKDGLYQYDYSNLSNIHQLSKISISK
jgi:hypothetical protein